VDSPGQYRAKAARFLRAASEATDPYAANMLRLAAADCLDLAEKVERGQAQQQQQIQPKTDDNKDQ
jgi:hypothetical protein